MENAGNAQVACEYQISPKRLEVWRGEWHANVTACFGSTPAYFPCRLR
jgi:hypothetical protein